MGGSTPLESNATSPVSSVKSKRAIVPVSMRPDSSFSMPSASVWLALASAATVVALPSFPASSAMAHASIASRISSASAAQSLQQWCESGSRRRTSRDASGAPKLTFWLLTTTS